MLALAASLLLAAQAPAPAPAPAKQKVLVFVDEIQADKALAADATALTTSLCTALSKSKDVDVACAPDLKQIMGFAASAGLMGIEQGSTAKIEQRLAGTTHVVTGRLRRDGAAYVLLLSTSEKGPESTGMMMVPGKALATSEERGDSSKAVLAKLDSAATKILTTVTPKK